MSRRLELHHDLLLDQQIESITTVEEEPVVANRLRLLPCDGVALATKLEVQTCLIGRLQQAGTKLSVHLDRRPNDPLCEGVQLSRFSAIFAFSALQPKLLPP